MEALESRAITTSNAGSNGGNPYFEEWLKQADVQRDREDRLLTADRAHDFETVAEIFSFRKSYIQKYAHAVPTPAALKAIASFAPIIEIGAGTGYWASLLRQDGVDILCYDQNPPGHPGSGNHFHKDATCWTEVLSGDDSAIDLYPNHTLLLCWPPPNSDMPARTLARYRGDHFIYVGELPTDEDTYLFLDRPGKPVRKGITIKPEFFAALRSSWELVLTVILPHWEICVDNLYIFERKQEPQGAR